MNCLAHALTRWHEDGGYIVLRKSAPRAWPHVIEVGLIQGDLSGCHGVFLMRSANAR